MEQPNLELETENEEHHASFTDDYLLYLLAQASAAASSTFHKKLAADGVSVSTWRILASLYPRRRLNVGALASQCLLKQPTLTRALDRLTKSGLVKRIHSVADRRGVLVELTDRGFALTEKKVMDAQTHEKRILGNYSDAERAELKKVLRVLISRSSLS